MKIIYLLKQKSTLFIIHYFTTEFIRAFKNMVISLVKYNKLKNNYYLKRILANKLLKITLKHTQYENEHIEKEIVYNLFKNI